MKSKVHPTYKTKYRVANWPAYNRALVRRGDVTLWVSSEAITAWTASRSGRRGGQRRYSDLAIETALTLRFILLRHGRAPAEQGEPDEAAGRRHRARRSVGARDGRPRVHDRTDCVCHEPERLTPAWTHPMIAGRDALSRHLKRTVALALLLALTPAAAAAQQGRLATGNWTRGLVGGWGHSWTPGYGKTKSDVQFVAFHPQLGRFVTNHLELYGEGTLFLYSQPETAVGGGAAAIGGRYHVWDDRGWTPYVVAISGLIWTNLSIPELDRVFNFQLIYGVGVRVVPLRGPGLIVEFRSHHISNAGTAGENLGVNAATVLTGVQWVLR